jgi:hypothetical protein
VTDSVDVLRAWLARIDHNKEEIRGRIDRALMAINMLPPADPHSIYPVPNKEVTDLLLQHHEQTAAGWWTHRELVVLQNRLKR